MKKKNQRIKDLETRVTELETTVQLLKEVLHNVTNIPYVPYPATDSSWNGEITQDMIASNKGSSEIIMTNGVK